MRSPERENDMSTGASTSLDGVSAAVPFAGRRHAHPPTYSFSRGWHESRSPLRGRGMSPADVIFPAEAA